jgi:hypothetical protein
MDTNHVDLKSLRNLVPKESRTSGFYMVVAVLLSLFGKS